MDHVQLLQYAMKNRKRLIEFNFPRGTEFKEWLLGEIEERKKIGISMEKTEAWLYGMRALLSLAVTEHYQKGWDMRAIVDMVINEVIFHE